MRQPKLTNLKASILTASIALVFAGKTTAQNINGDTILVSAETQTWLTFSSPPNGQVTKDASSFSITGTGKSLAIEPLKPNTRTTTLMVQEGSRTHQFIVFYKDDIDPSQSVYNFSDLKQIEKKVKEKATAKTPPVATASIASTPNNKTSDDKPAATNAPNKTSQDFAIAISNGDDLSEKERYPEAKEAYEKALQLKNNNEYAKTRLAAINKILADKEKLAAKLRDDNYNNALLKAAKAFTAKNYDEAKASYKESLESRPNDAFATNQIAAIDKLVVDNATKEKLADAKRQEEETYKTTIANADKAAASDDLATAKSYYSLAISYKPSDPYPKKKLEETERKIAAAAKDNENKERDKIYNNTISKAKAAFDTKSYEMSKELYNEALTLKPNDDFAKNQIKTIDRTIATQAQKESEEKKNEENEQAFKEAITLAENAYKAENYDEARSQYNKALAIKKDNKAESQIKNIDAILTKAKEKELSEKDKQAKEALRNSSYDQALKKGENLFSKKDYANAKIAYKQALNYKDEQQPKDRLSEIDNILADLESKSNEEKAQKAKEEDNEKKYAVAIQKAKGLEVTNDFENAKLAYLEALQLKPSDPTVKARIDALDKKATGLETDKKYDDAIAKGNIAIGDRQYQTALESFKEALKLKPLESYPLKQISYVQSVMTKETAVVEEKKKKVEESEGESQRILNFNDAMASYKRADTALSQRRWQDALGEYENFIRLIPDQKELNSYQYNTAGTIEFAKRKIIDLKNYLNRQKGSTYQSDAVPYSADDLKKKYPDVNFSTPQTIAQSADDDAISKASKNVLSETPRLTLADSTNSVKLTCLGISKKDNYVYVKLRILNSSAEDFLTGDMHLSTTRKKKAVSFEPVYVSSFPVVLPGKEYTFIYAAKDITVTDSETLSMQLNDRLKKTTIKLSIPGSVFNQEKNR